MEKINWINGETPINQANLNGMQNNIEKSCVAVSKTQPTTNESVWIKTGKNKFNKNTAISGYIGSNGAFVTGANNEVTSDYIEIESGKDYTLSIENWEGEQMWVGISLYDENKTFIERWDKYDASVTVPSTATQNAKYIRTSNRYNSNNIQIMLEQNSTATTYEDYIEKEIYVKNENGVFERFYREDEDSGVLNLTETGESYAYIKYRKVGKMVQVNSPWYSETGINIPAFGEVLLGTLPQGYAPTNKLNIPIYSKNKNNITSTNCLVSIGTDGKIKIVNASSTDANNIVGINFNTMYIVNE